MRKLLLSLALLPLFSVSAQSELSFDWSAVATVSGNKQTTAVQALPLENGNMLTVTTTTGTAGFSFAGQEIDLKDEGTTISPNLVINSLDKDGKILWTINSVRGGISFNSGALAVMPGEDIAMIAFTARFNAKGDTSADVVKLIDATGKYSSVPMTCPADYNPYAGVIMTFKPSNGEIITISSFESDYQSKVEGKVCAQPLFLQGVAADETGFYLTGYAYTETKYKSTTFTPAKIPADWNGSGTVGSGFIWKLDTTGNPDFVMSPVITEDTREGFYLIKADGSGEERAIYVVGMSNNSLITAKYHTTFGSLEERYITTNEIKDASNGSHNLLLKQVNCGKDRFYVTGHLAGGIGDIKTTGTSSNQFGFVQSFIKTTGLIDAGAVAPSFISGFYGAYENELNGNVCVTAYNMNLKKAYLTEYNGTFATINEQDIFTTAGTPAIWPSAFDEKNNRLIILGRANNKCLFGSQTVAEGFTAFSGFYAAYSLSNFKLADVEETIADVSENISVSGEQGKIVISSAAPVNVSIYNVSGVAVKTVTVNGETSVELPAGFYIAAGQKVAVK